MRGHLLIAAAAMAMASALAVAPGASARTVQPADMYPPACPDNAYCGYTFYSDAGHTQAIGVRGYDCQGRPVGWGVGVSAYPVWYSHSCGGGIPR